MTQQTEKPSEYPDYAVYETDDGWMVEKWTGPQAREDIAGPFKTKAEAEQAKVIKDSSHV